MRGVVIYFYRCSSCMVVPITKLKMVFWEISLQSKEPSLPLRYDNVTSHHSFPHIKFMFLKLPLQMPPVMFRRTKMILYLICCGPGNTWAWRTQIRECGLIISSSYHFNDHCYNRWLNCCTHVLDGRPSGMTQIAEQDNPTWGLSPSDKLGLIATEWEYLCWPLRLNHFKSLKNMSVTDHLYVWKFPSTFLH